MEENDDNFYLEAIDMIEPEIYINRTNSISFLVENEGPKKKGCYFPSAYVVLSILELIIFILTYIIPKGKFNTIEYDSKTESFIVKIYNKTSDPTLVTYESSQKTLDDLEIKIELDNFKLGYIKNPVSIPNTYTQLEDEENLNFFKLFVFPIYGMVNASDIGFFLMMIGGVINLLIEMKSLVAGFEALSRITKGHEFILLICAFILISIAGTTIGMAEEIFSFYPVLMPIFLKSGFDGALAGGSLYFGSIIGNMFSTVNAFAVVIASYSAGINFIDGIIFRVIGFILGDALTIGYFFYYHKKVKENPLKSAVYDIKDEIYDKFNKMKERMTIRSVRTMSEEEINLKGNNNEDIIINKFTVLQKISLILFGGSFIIFIVGITALDWWFEQIGAIFLVLGIIIIFLIRKGEQKGIEIFTKGASDFVGIIIVIGLARGINLTLDQGYIQDTILNYLTNLVDGFPKIIFALIVFIVFIILGIFIQSNSGLAVLSMPVFAPLADKVNCPRKIVVNAYMFGQTFISFLSPTGLTLIVLQIIGMKFTHWLKFIWLFLIVLFVLLVILLILDTVIET